MKRCKRNRVGNPRSDESNRFSDETDDCCLERHDLGGGCKLALICDLRIAETHVRIDLPEIKLGIFPGGGGEEFAKFNVTVTILPQD